MIKTGLVSVTFRKLAPKELVSLTKQAGLDGIEWGGDLHVPPGDILKARQVYELTTDEGIDIAAYGSYYRIGCQENCIDDFKRVLESAVELKAPTIRVWAGNKSSKEADQFWWEKIVSESRVIAELAGEAGISISYEYHRNTLTDSNETAVRLLENVNHQNVYTYWQPLSEYDFHIRAQGLTRIKTKLTNLHVFHWISNTRAPLKLGTEDWSKYLQAVLEEKNHYALLEFVMNDSETQLRQDAETLKTLVSVLNKTGSDLLPQKGCSKNG